MRKVASIKVISFRKRPVDVDNISSKYLVDSLVSAGVLEDDCPKFVEEVTHQQLWTKDKEQTIVSISFREIDDEGED